MLAFVVLYTGKAYFRKATKEDERRWTSCG
jgi:hypothetical protein